MDSIGNTRRLLQKLNEKEELEYSFDQYGEVGILNYYKKLELNLEKFRSKLKSKYNLRSVVIKDHTNTDTPTTISIGDTPEEIVVEENNIRYKIHPLDLYEGLSLDQRLIKELIKENSSNKEVLDLFAGNGSYTLNAISGGAIRVDSVEVTHSKWLKDNLELNSELNTKEVTIWEESFNNFINIAYETNTRYDLVILDCSKYNLINRPEFNLITDQVSMVRRIQDRLLKTSGYFFLITDLDGFVMDPYIRKGADKITKKTTLEEFKPLATHQSFVFYN